MTHDHRPSTLFVHDPIIFSKFVFIYHLLNFTGVDSMLGQRKRRSVVGEALG